ncbi:bifunctional riboflavin kinase/FAD synthetase [Marinobacter zhejiangensis]|uniref:Riboflavin biosynthesis protein n=1 Tax=Marinobacter zhejiangensis TaxID=488535 RepID=A0A1I4S8M8_9GAMM|nr:bifunctional riboflavin kinase/FAD synthetase [Marinobacter zhejiangensis]SFM60623.1 riboflavin kinase / FMN adenylyltransferase [Marinobacter zhejiangensis]
MRLIRGLTSLQLLSRNAASPLADGCVATIGNFDGVHLGHQAIINQVREKARALGVPAVAMVFEPQPREFFQGDQAPPRLTGFREKCCLLLNAGIDVVLCLRFDEQFRSYSAMGFIDDLLVQGLNVRHLVVGDDFRFGCDRSGDFELLNRVGEAKGFSVENTRTITVAGERVSSTAVREALTHNQLDLAEALLGRPYAIAGKVTYGRQLGREIGAPTANIRLKRLAPLQGVYVIQADLPDGRVCDGVANIGLRPTVDGRQPSLEVHLFDFAGTLYGQRIRVTFRHPLRNEEKFSSVDALKVQIARDFDNARLWLAEH